MRPRWLPAAAALAAGGATALSLSPLHLLPLAFGHAVLLALVAGAADTRRAAARAWMWALGYHVVGLHWIANAMLVNAGEHAWLIPFANLGLPAFLALFAAGAAALARRLFVGGWPLWLGFSALYAGVEWLRGNVLTGFPWNLPSATVDGWTVLLQPAALVGAYGLSLLVLLVTTAPALWLDAAVSRRARIVGSATAVALLAAVAGWGTARMNAIPPIDAPGGSVDGVVVRVVQGNVPQRDKWNPLLRPEHLQRYLSLSDAGRPADLRAPGLAPESLPTVTVWPETAVAQLVGDGSEALAVLADAAPIGGTLVFGAPRVARIGPLISIYNSVFALSRDPRPDARTLWHFDKAHLVPFGEYVPLRSVIPLNPIVAARRDFTAGPGPRTLSLDGAPPVSVLICYEAIFPGGAVDPAARPGWLLNATNDAWFGRWSGPHQHLAIARLRAVEQGLPMVRAANTGISSVIDSAGRIVARLDIGHTGSLDSPLPAATAPTLFEAKGDVPFSLMVVLLTIFAAYGRFRAGRRSPGN